MRPFRPVRPTPPRALRPRTCSRRSRSGRLRCNPQPERSRGIGHRGNVPFSEYQHPGCRKRHTSDMFGLCGQGRRALTRRIALGGLHVHPCRLGHSWEATESLALVAWIDRVGVTQILEAGRKLAIGIGIAGPTEPASAEAIANIVVAAAEASGATKEAICPAVVARVRKGRRARARRERRGRGAHRSERDPFAKCHGNAPLTRGRGCGRPTGAQVFE
jgi:hypothetical protein